MGEDFAETQSPRAWERRRGQFGSILRFVRKDLWQFAGPNPALASRLADFVFANQTAFPLPVAQFIEIDRTTELLRDRGERGIGESAGGGGGSTGGLRPAIPAPPASSGGFGNGGNGGFSGREPRAINPETGNPAPRKNIEKMPGQP